MLGGVVVGKRIIKEGFTDILLVYANKRSIIINDFPDK